MAQPSASLTFYGEKAELFREVKEELEEEKGFDLNNADVGAELLASYHQNERRR